MTDAWTHLPLPQPLLIVLSGPSGVGKDTVLTRMKERRLAFHFVVTATTRPPRPGEVHGRDYFFISNDEFAEMIDKNELFEWARVYNDYKGIPKQQVRHALASSDLEDIEEAVDEVTDSDLLSPERFATVLARLAEAKG